MIQPLRQRLQWEVATQVGDDRPHLVLEAVAQLGTGPGPVPTVVGRTVSMSKTSVGIIDVDSINRGTRPS